MWCRATLCLRCPSQLRWLGSTRSMVGTRSASADRRALLPDFLGAEQHIIAAVPRHCGDSHFEPK